MSIDSDAATLRSLMGCRKVLAAVYAKLHESFCVPAGQATDCSDATVGAVHIERLQKEGDSHIDFSCSHAGRRFDKHSAPAGQTRCVGHF